MNTIAFVLCTILVAANAGITTLHHAVHEVHEVHAVVPAVVHATPVVTRVVPAAHSSSFSYRAPAAKVLVHSAPVIHTPIVHATPLRVHHTPIVHATPVVHATPLRVHHAPIVHHVGPIVSHHVAAAPLLLH